MTPSKTKADPKQVAAQVRAYHAAQTPAARRFLKALRDAIAATAPDATPIFSYGIPGFRLEGHPLIWYAAWKNHVSVYPFSAETLKAAKVDPRRYETSKGTIRFPLDEPPPIALVKRLLKLRMAELKDQTGDRRPRAKANKAR